MTCEIAGLCFTGDAGTALEHDVLLVVLSYLIAACGSYTALELIDHWRGAGRARALPWQIASAGVLGGSIWVMHFVAMLAMTLEFPVTYAPAPTVASLLVVLAAVGAGLRLVRTRASLLRVVAAGTVVGLGVVAMHTIGMSAMRFPGRVAYAPGLWALSVLVGISAATAALWLSLTLDRHRQRVAFALVVGLAICGVHYTGAAATVLLLDPLWQVTPGLTSGPVAALVAATSLVLAFCALVVVASDRTRAEAAQRDAETLRLAYAQLERASAESERGRQQFDMVLAKMAQGVCFFDGERRLLLANHRYSEIYDLPPGAARVGMSLAEVVDLRAAAGSGAQMPTDDYLRWRGQVATADEPSSTTVQLTNGRVIAITHQPMPDGGWVATHEDITARQQAEADVIFMAHHDALTRLPNRVLFQERLEQALVMVGRGTPCAVLCLDLDHFKLINDTLGHPVGDGLLQAVAARLQACVREGDTVARLGGDEFAIVQRLADDPNGADILASRIIAAFAHPAEVGEHQLMVGVSIGVTLAPHDGNSSTTLLKNADIALYLAKSEGRGTVRFFEPEMDARIQARRRMELDLRHAIANHEFELYYQPLVNLAAGRVIGFEALLRWHHPTRGLVSPVEFIPVVEENGMIVAIGDWVLETACAEAMTWPAEIKVAINLSPVQFKRGNLVAAVEAALVSSALPPDRLELEITESVLLQDTDETLAALHKLRGMGIAISLDDFGTGYSSLSYLRSFPFDKVKIDQSFVADLALNQDSISIVRAITGLGHSLRMRTTAEGVETLEQLERLRQEGCTEVQGYIFSRPRPAAELPQLLESLSRGSEVLV